MDEITDTVVKRTPIICGAIYERDRNGSIEQVQCIARLEEHGRVHGLFRRYGLTFERFGEETEDLLSWKLVWAPDGSHEPTPKPKKSSKRVAKAVE
jgi:hypothetical protein